MTEYIKSTRTLRLTAELIDEFLLVIILVIFTSIDSPDWFWMITFDSGIPFLSLTIPSIGGAILLFYFFTKDLMFKNASLGKRMMGLIILDDKWNVPNAKQIFKRGVTMTVMGMVVYSKTYMTEGDFEGWELSKSHTRVMPKSTFERLKGIAQKTSGSFEDNMDILYYQLLSENNESNER